MAIRKANNKVEVEGSEKPFGGEVVDLSYSVSFAQAPSSMSITIASSNGEYELPELNSEEPMSIKFGGRSIKMLPVGYKRSRGTSARTLIVDFDDMSLKYLDKTFVLLTHKQLSTGLPRMIQLGRMYIDDNEQLVRYYGQYRPDAQIRYDIRDLVLGIEKAGIPISKDFFNFLRQFRTVSINEVDEEIDQSFARSESGSLRDVLSSIAADLGFIFFWNNDDIQGADKALLTRQVINGKEGEGYLDFIKFVDDVDASDIQGTISEYDEYCNIEDDSEELSIRGSYIKGAIGAFSVNSSATRNKSEPFARFRFMDQIESPHTLETYNLGANQDIGGANYKQRYELELLLKAATISKDFYIKYVSLKLVAYAMSGEAEFDIEDYNILSVTMNGRNQKPDGTQADLGQKEGNIIGPWIEGERNKKFPLNLTRNSIVETFYKNFVFQPSVISADQDVKAGAKEKRKGINPKNSYFGRGVNELINKRESFVLSLRDENPRWTACVIDKSDQTDKLVQGVDKFFAQIEFLSKNFGRHYYSVERTDGFSVAGAESNTSGEISAIYSDESITSSEFRLSPDVDFSGPGTFGTRGTRFNKSPGTFGTETFTERPSLFVEREFAKRKYSGSNPSWIFSDLAVTESPFAAYYTVVNTDDEGNLPENDKTTSDYHMVKDGQSRPPIVTLPCSVQSPTDRKITVEGYDNIISTYGFIRYFESPTIRPVRHTTVSNNESYPRPESYIEKGSYKEFETETIGVSSVESIVQSLDPDDGLCVRGGNLPPQTAGSMSAKSYEEIQNQRTESGDVYQYPTDLDYGILVFDAYSLNPDRDDANITIDLKTDLFDSDEGDDGSAIFKIEDKTIFVTELPANEPTKNELISEFWSADIFQDEIDEQLSKVELPFSLREVRNRLRLNYSYSLSDVLTGIRTSYIPQRFFEKVTAIDIEDITFDPSDLILDTETQETEFPLKNQPTVSYNIPALTSSLKKIIELYVDENLGQSLSRDFKVSGFGFGDDDLIPSIYEGLESISVSLNEGGVSTNIKIGNKRRTKESIDLKRTMLFRQLAGVHAPKVATNQVSKIFSNKLMAKF